VHVDIHASAVGDLEELWAADPKAAAIVAVVLDELQADPTLAGTLIVHGDAPLAGFRLGVSKWQKARTIGAQIWRFRIFDTPATSYRVVYGYHAQTKQLCVLAVVHKENFDYEFDSPIGARILDDWRSL
jgi:mRNA-degrading endonuclease RelE of RelBE toxin-antitoxin system